MPALRATYRLQLGPDLTFADVAELVPYLRDLGISHLYLSPSLQARSGSTHGYDVVDPTRVSETLGGEAGLRALADLGLGIVLDVVPNHMGIGDENPWWADEAQRAKYFDVDPDTGFYRRFFDIDDLAGLRIEDPEVFEATHAKVLELVEDGVVDGLRIDHPDGLADPAEYLGRLAERGVEHVWVEKILHGHEALRPWPVEGTVGYEFLNDATALFVDPAAEGPLTALWHEIAQDERPFADYALEAQREQASTTFHREVARLHVQLDDVSEAEIAEALCTLPIYRTYVDPQTGEVADADREAIAAATLSERLAKVLLLEEPGHPSFVTRFQQTSPPVTAKGIEDTAFYRYHRLLALNEVGSDPGRFGLSVADFHKANLRRAERHPLGMLTTQTHDTKRSGDMRARIGALSEVPELWKERVARWRELSAPLRCGGTGAPDPTEEYLVFQTLVGVWPVEPERLDGYLLKALREAKRHTSWIEPDEAHERRVQAFARGLLTHEPFVEDLRAFLDDVGARGRRSALAQLLLKLTVPGIPDLYQGDELEALSLVDPDNRRPVDWAARRDGLAALRDGRPVSEEGRKLDLVARALALRARRPECFDARGSYAALEAGAGVCAFTRGDGVAVVVGVRDWADAQVGGLGGTWRDVLADVDRDLDDASVGVAELVDERGLALLERRST